jgi:hypothetical protein
MAGVSSTLLSNCDDVDASLLKSVYPHIERSDQLSSLGFSVHVPPREAWNEDGLTYFVFDGEHDPSLSILPPMALFVVDGKRQKVVSIRLVLPDSQLTQADVLELAMEE